MIPIPWKDRYNIDYKEIDPQHRELLAILNELGALVDSGAGVEQITAVFQRLSQYAMLHFSTEERYLEAGGYEQLASHRAEHAWFISRLLELDRSYEAADPLLLEATLAFLKDWYIEHIIRSDQDYAPCLKSLRRRAEIRAVIFDFGKVIAGFDNQVFLDGLAALSAVPAAQLERQIYQESSLAADYECGAISSQEFLLQIARICGRDLTEAEFLPLFTGHFTPIAATCDLIRRLKPNYRLGLISNTNAWHFQHVIQPSPVFPLFDAVTLSHEVGAMKPDPRLYQDALDKLGLVAEQCVFIDDNPEFAAAADDCLLHGIAYRAPLQLIRDLRALKVRF